MKETVLNALKGLYPVRERELGQDHELKKSGMKFIITAYDIEGFGSMSVINMTAMLGLMHMESFVVTAETKDLPLFSGDFIKAAGKCTLLMEFYDTMLSPLDEASAAAYQAVKTRYADLPRYETGPHWYDPIRYPFTLGAAGKGLKEKKDSITEDYVKAYLANIGRAPACDAAEKKAKTKAYVDGLLTHGGPAADQFRKLFGEENARRIFEKHVFSCR